MLERRLVDGVAGDAFGEIKDRLELGLSPRLEDPIYDLASESLDGLQAIPDLVVDNRELLLRGVDVGRLELDVHAPALLEIFDNLVGIVHLAGHHCGHEFSRVVRLEVGCLVAQDRVSGGVGLVEPVAREFFDEVVDLLRSFNGDLVFLGALDELVRESGHELLLLLSHRAPEGVRLAQAEARELIGDAHHLLLVEDDAVGLGQDG